jgi:molybdenum cofactor cytidylyltransferase
MLPAVVLAAGASTRMGTPKALLPSPDGRPFIARIVRTLAAAGLDTVVVVTGADHDAIVSAVRADAPAVLPRFARNPDPGRGQLSSIWAGMDAALNAGSEGLAITLVDVPMVEVATVVSVVEAWRRTRAPVVRPAIGERHGHPVIFDAAVFGALREAPLEAGAKVVVRAHESRLVNVAVADEGCLVDVDTREDYEALRRGRG